MIASFDPCEVPCYATTRIAYRTSAPARTAASDPTAARCRNRARRWSCSRFRQTRILSRHRAGRGVHAGDQVGYAALKQVPAETSRVTDLADELEWQYLLNRYAELNVRSDAVSVYVIRSRSLRRQRPDVRAARLRDIADCSE